MKAPSNVKTTSTQQKLNNGPADMPNTGGAKPNMVTTSERVNLSRTEHGVANTENKPGNGKVVCTSEKVNLNRAPVAQYDKFSATTPRMPGK